MPKITYIEADGASHTLEVPVGESVMRGAVMKNVPGILAECGGACACATCQVFVDAAWMDKIPPPQAMEASMLDGEDGVTRRLSCQITVTEALDGLVVRMPKTQR
jgi:2Fe-2S ferredoxin